MGVELLVNTMDCKSKQQVFKNKVITGCSRDFLCHSGSTQAHPGQ